MDKQEEIKEGLAQNLAMLEGCPWNNLLEKHDCLGTPTKGTFRWRATTILKYLHSQGVVLKVEKELLSKYTIPITNATSGSNTRSSTWMEDYRKEEIYDKAQQDMLNAGWRYTEPLMKE